MREEERDSRSADDGSGESPAAPDGPGDTSQAESLAPDAWEESAADGHFHCDLCGAVMIESHCKLICPACGYQRDCSDP